MNKVQVRLQCRHLVRISLDRVYDHTAYCGAHGWQDVRVVFTDEVHAFCIDCNAGKWCGQAVSAGESFVMRHATNNPSHRVVWRWDQVTKNGRGNAKDEYRQQLAKDALAWENETVTATAEQEIIPF